MLPIRDVEFDGIRRFVYQQTGIALGPEKQALVVSRLNERLRVLKIRSFGAYLRRAAHDAAERQMMIDAITTNETHFFRERAHWDLLVERVIPRWREEQQQGLRSRRLLVWSAGCSTGEEPFSIAMVLLSELPASEGWSHEIVATDISQRVLAKASAATWRVDKQHEIPRPLLQSFMLRGVGSREGQMQATAELRSIVTFAHSNLNDPRSYPAGAVDAIFCRNVLIYFDNASRAAAVEHVTTCLAPGGYLFLGHSESLHSVAGMTPVGRSAFRKT